MSKLDVLTNFYRDFPYPRGIRLIYQASQYVYIPDNTGCQVVVEVVI